MSDAPIDLDGLKRRIQSVVETNVALEAEIERLRETHEETQRARMELMAERQGKSAIIVERDALQQSYERSLARAQKLTERLVETEGHLARSDANLTSMADSNRTLQARLDDVQAVHTMHRLEHLKPVHVICSHCHRDWPCPTVAAIEGTVTE